MQLQLKRSSIAPLNQLAANLAAAITSRGDDFVSQNATKTLVSLESVDQHSINALDNTFAQVRESLRAQLNGIPGLAMSFGLEAAANATADEKAEAARRMDIALDAGGIAALACGAPEEFARQSYSGVARPEAGKTLVDTMGGDGPTGMDYRSNVAMEAFNEHELRQHLPYSILFNIFASRQDDFSEMFFPTTVVPPDQAGIDITVARMTVFNEMRHLANGNKADLGKKNLIDAQVDHTILSDEHTKLIPVVQADNSNADKFVGAGVVAPFNVRVGNYDVPTAPLKLDQTVDLLGISTFQPLLGAGIIDHSDDIDARVALDHLYLAVGNGKGIAFPVNRLARSAFNKSVEGNSREMNLQFANTDLVIDAQTLAVDGTVVTAFAGIVAGPYTVRLGINVSGTLNVEYGNVNVWAAAVTVASIQDANGNTIPTGSGAGAAIVSDLATLKIVGYTLKANRTNANMRTRGHLLDSVNETARYTIPLGSPISITSPVTADTGRDAGNQKALIAAVRTRNSNNAVTALLAIADQLRESTKGPRLPAGQVSGVGGMGRHVVDAFFEEHEIDLDKSINSIKSQDRAADISATLVSACRDVAYRMYQWTKIQPAIDQLTGTAGEAPTLLVGTDQVLIRHLLVNGDSRTFGTVFDKAVVKASTDRRVYGKIFLTMTCSSVEGPSPLTFGTHGWMSELIGMMPVSRGGQVSREATVQPRTLHINNMPILAIITVKGLTKALVDRTATPPLAAAGVNNVYLDGLKYPPL